MGPLNAVKQYVGATLISEVKNSEKLDFSIHRHEQLEAAIRDLKQIKDNIQRVAMLSLMSKLLRAK
jgi:hypothetical protein